MTSLSTIIFGFIVIIQAIYAQNNKEQTSSIPKPSTPANMTYDELIYIYQSRQGVKQAKPKNLTPCAKAILSCCNDKTINEHCSESLKCGAYFFDDNPCDDKFILDALKAAKIFYEQMADH